MCDSIAEGGRRCPGCSGPARAAYRKAAAAAKRAPEGGIGAGGAAGPDVTEAWDLDAVRAAISAVRGMDDPAEREAAVRAIGASIAGEAERRAGVSAADVAERKALHLQECEDRVLEAETRVQFVQASASDPEDLYAQGTDLYYDFNRAHRDLREAKETRDFVLTYGVYLEVQKDLRALGDGYTSVLSEVRPMGGQIDIYEENECPEAEQAVKDAATLYPTDWITASNHTDTVLWVVEAPGMTSHYRGAPGIGGAEISVAHLGAPVTRGNGFYNQALHEVGHHFEAVVPDILELEQEFFLRRTTDPQTGERVPFTPLPLHATLEVRADSFADAYMGREYPKGQWFELLTTGMEALQSGRYGGLVGTHRYPADLDMRAFVLGTLASTGYDPDTSTPRWKDGV